MSCAPKKDERVEGVFYGIGDLMESNPTPVAPSPEDVNNAEHLGPADDLPF